jgi:6-pyruvoyltetrahydropterin/6-carboxytetrahydropterin synthase
MITFKEFSFEAAHQIPPHSGLHGHSFKVEIALGGEPDPVFGWSANLDEVDRAIDGVRRLIDHRYLNDVEGLEVPSLENVARWIWQRLGAELPGLRRVTVRRGADGQAEGCVYEGEHEAGRRRRPAAQQLALQEI